MEKEITIKPRFFTEEQIRIVSEKKNGRFVVESTVYQRSGWLNLPVAIFYTEEAHPASNSHYFGFLFSHDGTPYIVDGQTAAATPFSVMEKNGEYYNSVYRHDCCMVDGEAIDGGRDYVHVLGNPRILPAKIVKDKVVVTLAS